MSSCCGEPSCRRKNPISLYLGDFSGQVYAVTRSRVVSVREDSTTLAALDRHDVTAAMRAFIHRHPEWVRAVLAERENGNREPRTA